MWIVISVPTGITGFWLLFAYMLSIQNDIIRTVVIWSAIFLLTVGAAATDYLASRQSK